MEEHPLRVRVGRAVVHSHKARMVADAFHWQDYANDVHELPHGFRLIVPAQFHKGGFADVADSGVGIQ